MNYNESQLSVINGGVKAVSRPFVHPRICLIQGPPGTGKTHTISGIVLAVITVSFAAPDLCCYSVM